MKSKYDQILELPHHISKTHPQMPMADRAAQFAPFAALTGYDDAIRETGRLTEDKVDAEENYLQMLDVKLQLLRDHLADAPEVVFTYFQEDERKCGGAYLTVSGKVKKIEEYERQILLQDGTRLRMDDILDISSSLWEQ